MKKLILCSIILLYISAAHAQVNNDSTPPNKVVNPTATYQLFPTQNIWNFIKLDTRNGMIWQVQWATDSAKRFVSILNFMPLVPKDDEKDGRFTLYPTQNIYTFLLLDQTDGRTWQVQWSFDADKRLVIPVL